MGRTDSPRRMDQGGEPAHPRGGPEVRVTAGGKRAEAVSAESHITNEKREPWRRRRPWEWECRVLLMMATSGE